MTPAEGLDQPGSASTAARCGRPRVDRCAQYRRAAATSRPRAAGCKRAASQLRRCAAAVRVIFPSPARCPASNTIIVMPAGQCPVWSVDPHEHAAAVYGGRRPRRRYAVIAAPTSAGTAARSARLPLPRIVSSPGASRCRPTEARRPPPARSPQPRQQQHHRVVAPTGRRTPITHGPEAAQIARLEPLGQARQSPARHRGTALAALGTCPLRCSQPSSAAAANDQLRRPATARPGQRDSTNPVTSAP